MKPWPDKKRIEVATAHAMGLSSAMIEVATGVPRRTVEDWRREDWFKDLVAEIRTEDDNVLDGKFTKIVSKSLDVIVDRLENGDFMYDPKRGTFVRKPLAAKDVTRVTDVMFDKRNLLRGKPTSITGKTEQISERLLKLASEFEKFVNSKIVDGEVVTHTHNDHSDNQRVAGTIGIGAESGGTVQEQVPSGTSTSPS